MSPIRWRIEEFATIDSTNTWLKDRAARGEAEGLVARADFQSAGRGRLDRRWEAPPGSSLLTSLLLRPQIPDEDLYLVTVSLALSVRTALVRLCGLRPDIKWPNDLVVGGDKLGGILAEVVIDESHNRAIVVGLGLNLTYAGPEGVNATCVRDAAGVTLSPQSVLDLVLEEFEPRLEGLAHGERESVRTEFVSALRTIGQRVRVVGPLETTEGLAEAVDVFGRLGVRTQSATVWIAVGDVTHVIVDA